MNTTAVTYNKNGAFAAACAGMLLFGITIVTLGSLAPEIRQKFGLNDQDAGILFSILPVGLILGSLVFGPISDRYGYRHLLTLAFVGVFLGFEGIAYAESMHVLRASVLLFGISGGVINGAANSIVVDVSDEHKGPNLMILGIFFGVGALGMPLLLGIIIRYVAPLQVLAVLGWITLVLGIGCQFIGFPPAKQGSGKLRPDWKKLFSPILLLISFYLFFQSSLESLVTNWTTTYVSYRGASASVSLIALSVHMIGMVAMRIITGTLFRGSSQVIILWICLGLVILGLCLMMVPHVFPVMAGLFLTGAGLSGGFPVMLGFVGHRFPEISGTAISFVFVIALTGNMLINYLTGLVIQRYGVGNLPMICLTEVMAMTLLIQPITRKLRGPSE